MGVVDIIDSRFKELDIQKFINEQGIQDKDEYLLVYYMIISFIMTEIVESFDYSLNQTLNSLHKKIYEKLPENSILLVINNLNIDKIKNLINVSVKVLNEKLGFQVKDIDIITSFSYIITIQYDLFYLESSRYFVPDYINRDFENKIYDLYSTDENKLKNYYKLYLNAKQKLRGLLKHKEKNLYNIEKLSFQDRDIINEKDFEILCKNTNLKIDRNFAVFENGVFDLEIMYKNLLDYLNLKINTIHKTNIIVINNFCIESSVENFIYMLMVLMKIKNGLKLKRKMQNKIISSLSNLIKNNLLYLGFLESYANTNFKDLFLEIKKLKSVNSLF
ncbi:MAG: hypothetical protein KatS3mg068_1569 [Candidatus Sericytochromatia bacterium]|nr:MAG: hypothetical protein KatS3mg068_1569 [Candidatus Sericytochromatia bacterium]